MNEEELYNFLQSLMPEGLQFVNPYIDKATPPLGDWAQMNIINIQEKGRSQERQVSYNEEEGIVEVAFDQTRIYTIQFDFFGANALLNCNTFKQNLQVNLDRNSHINKSSVGLKTMGDTKNLTWLLENKKYLKRYSFDFDLFVVDTITQSRTYLTGANINITPYSY